MTWRLQALALIAFAAAMLLPARVQAAILPVCDRDDGVTVTAPPPEPVCEVVTTVDDVTGTTKAAPICDPRGASAVAPPRVLPVADARIEAGSSCGDADGDFAFAPSRSDAPSSSMASPLVEPAHLPALSLVPWSGYVGEIDFLVRPGAPRAGVRRQVERPPC